MLQQCTTRNSKPLLLRIDNKFKAERIYPSLIDVALFFARNCGLRSTCCIGSLSAGHLLATSLVPILTATAASTLGPPAPSSPSCAACTAAAAASSRAGVSLLIMHEIVHLHHSRFLLLLPLLHGAVSTQGETSKRKTAHTQHVHYAAMDRAHSPPPEPVAMPDPRCHCLFPQCG